MLKLTILVIGLGLMTALTGCGASCESVQDEIQKIGREIQKKPETAMDRSRELEALRDKLRQMGCLG